VPDSSDTPRPPVEGADAPTGIGVDDWVAQSGERREDYRGFTAPARRAFDNLRPGWRLAIVAGAAATVPYLVKPGGVRIAIGILILAMLALGLNVVVGWAGLLDLGFVAFFGFGAYFYAIVASEQLPAHWPTWIALPIIVFFSGALGVLVSLASRRLVGDYLAILTLFFSLIFVELVRNFQRLPFVSEDLNLTGGPNGIPGVDPWDFFGFKINTFNRHYYVLLVLIVLLIVALHNLSSSRTGRAWRAIRDDVLAAEHMTMPVNNLMLLAFATGAAIAGFTGTVFAAVTVGVFPTSFTLVFLITVYSAVILGGSGSIPGVLLGALVIGYLPELLRSPRLAGLLFYFGLLVALVVLIKPWQRLVAVIGGVVVFGYAVRLVAEAAWADATTGTAAEGFISELLDGWVLILGENAEIITNVGFVAAIVGALAVTVVKGWWQVAVLIPTIYLGVLVWENRLVFQPSLTRQLVFGALLVIMMAVRPQGLLGKKRVEIT
jgi:branched-chain amino acid transport system permease protein